jgi:hypothetical protein
MPISIAKILAVGIASAKASVLQPNEQPIAKMR